jgi:hypothetical protein
MLHAATLDMNIESVVDESGLITMTLSGTINGLYSQGTLNTNAATEKFDNAEAVLTLLDAQAYFIAKEYYARPEYSLYEIKGDTDLNKTVRTKTIGRNKLTGVITFSYTYNDSKMIVDNALSNTLAVTDDNEKENIQIIAIIPIIAKPHGPIFQDMNTTKEKRRTLNLGAIMKKDWRNVKPDSSTGQLGSIIDGYKPNNSYVQSWNESWEPLTGNYSVSVEWVYK